MNKTAKIALIVGGVVAAAGIGYLVYINMKNKSVSESESEPTGNGNAGTEPPQTEFSDLPQGGDGPVRAPITNWTDLGGLIQVQGGSKGVQFDASGPLTADTKYKEFLPK